ncbi:nucleotidyltransferase domain-containing protein [Castellaniella sp.]|uniref:nucleotidyltransferase domain-containing protein n=1 Tax=Castellaniella sp. TaxID=1955812 RepID=UPI002AFFA5EF|nr:nucleotidyltransferase domain-containing protein [Castellaniella sp.]
MEFVELEDQQRLHLVESDQLLRAWIEAKDSLQPYRYGLRWVTRGDRRYLIRPIDAHGNSRSLGPESEKTHAILTEYEAGRQRARARYDGLSDKLIGQARMNRALRLGRLPQAAASILGALNTAGLDREFLVVGTHALFAYEAMAAVQVRPGALASQDLDLCFDARRPLLLVTKKLGSHQDKGLLGLLQKVDKSYEPMNAKGVFRAVNASGFMVDLITPQRPMKDNHPVTFGQDDLVAAEVPNLHWLINAPKCQVVTIASSGRPVMMEVPDPRAFALHKAWLSQQPAREPAKRQRDKGQAAIVVAIVGQYLPQFPFSPQQLRYLSLDMLHLALNALPPGHNEADFLVDLRKTENDDPEP